MSIPEKVSLWTNTLLPLLPSPPASSNNFMVNQTQLQQIFVPFAASSSGNVDNAKMALLVEHLVFAFYVAGEITPTKEFGDAIEKGIDARKQRANWDARKKNRGGVTEADAKEVLEMSSQRLLTLLEIIEAGGFANGRYDGQWNSASLPWNQIM